MNLHKANRVTRCQDLIESLSSRLAKKNFVTIDEKFFHCRNMKPWNVIGNWIVPDGDEKRRQTARRTTMESKFMAIIAVSQGGQHYFEVLEHNLHVNGEKYVEFLKGMQNVFANLKNPILTMLSPIQHLLPLRILRK